MPEFVRLDHIQLCIPMYKEAEARAFYCDILGLMEIEKPASLKPNGGFWLQIADIQLHIGLENSIEKSKRHPAFEVKNLQQLRAYLQANNVLIKEDIPIDGIERFSIFDPFGNRIELLQKVK